VAALQVLAAAYLASGEEDRARQLLPEIDRFASARPERYISIGPLQLRARLAALESDWASAAQFFEKALAIARHLHFQYKEARVLHDYGQIQLEKGDATGGEARLREALVIFQRLGARPYIERTDQLLARIG
jgi:hypothetical protein